MCLERRAASNCDKDFSKLFFAVFSSPPPLPSREMPRHEAKEERQENKCMNTLVAILPAVGRGLGWEWWESEVSTSERVNVETLTTTAESELSRAEGGGKWLTGGEGEQVDQVLSPIGGVSLAEENELFLLHESPLSLRTDVFDDLTAVRRRGDGGSHWSYLTELGATSNPRQQRQEHLLRELVEELWEALWKESSWGSPGLCGDLRLRVREDSNRPCVRGLAMREQGKEGQGVRIALSRGWQSDHRGQGGQTDLWDARHQLRDCLLCLGSLEGLLCGTELSSEWLGSAGGEVVIVSRMLAHPLQIQRGDQVHETNISLPKIHQSLWVCRAIFDDDLHSWLPTLLCWVAQFEATVRERDLWARA
jgi:hypothetical protein